MSSNGGRANVPLFAPEYRASGLLLHVTSLPSPLRMVTWAGPTAVAKPMTLVELGRVSRAAPLPGTPSSTSTATIANANSLNNDNLRPKTVRKNDVRGYSEQEDGPVAMIAVYRTTNGV